MVAILLYYLADVIRCPLMITKSTIHLRRTRRMDDWTCRVGELQHYFDNIDLNQDDLGVIH